MPVLAWGAVAYGGVALVILGGAQADQGSVIGNALMIAAAMVWACGTVLSQPLVQRHSPYTMLTLSIPGALPVVLPYGLSAALATPWSEFSTATWLAFGHIVLIAGVLAFIGFYVGVRQIGASSAMFYQYLIPPLAAVFAWIVFGKALMGLQWVGFLITLGAVVMASRDRPVLVDRHPYPAGASVGK